MANFTINSLTDGTVVASDSFIKSDSNGVLTKVSVDEIGDAINGTTDISALGSGTVNGIIASLWNSLTTTDKASQVVANTNLGFTLGVVKYMAYGNVRQFYAQITTTSAIAQWAQLFTGLDAAAAIPYCNYDGALFDIESGKVVGQTALTSGKVYRITFTYIV